MAFSPVPKLNASLTISSPNLTNDSLSLASTCQFTKAGTDTPLDQTSGIGRKTTSSTSIYVLFDGADYTVDKAHKIYIRNTSTVATEYVLVTLESTELGRLYAGDFLVMPWGANADTNDISITPSVATSMTIEYAIFSEV